jgi:hypothetical protein
MELQIKILLTAIIAAVVNGILWTLKDVTQTAKKVFSLIFDISFIAIIISLIWMIWTL